MPSEAETGTILKKFVRITSNDDGYDWSCYTIESVAAFYQGDETARMVATWLVDAKAGDFLHVDGDMIFAVGEGQEITRVQKTVIERRKLT